MRAIFVPSLRGLGRFVAMLLQHLRAGLISVAASRLEGQREDVSSTRGESLFLQRAQEKDSGENSLWGRCLFQQTSGPSTSFGWPHFAQDDRVYGDEEEFNERFSFTILVPIFYRLDQNSCYQKLMSKSRYGRGFIAASGLGFG